MMGNYEKKEDIVLSICVPTYNRHQKVFDNIKKLKSLIYKYEKYIELLVGNNGSTDETNLVLEKFKDIKIITLEENNGINPVLLNLAKLAQGKFLWLLGDDDFIADDVLEIIISNILENKNLEHSYFLTGKNYYSDSELSELEKTSYIRQKKSTEKITNNLINKSGFISSHIVNRELYLKGFIKSLSYSKLNSYATKFACLYSHQMSNKIFHIDNALFIGRITGKESYFVNNNPNITIKTLLFDEFGIIYQVVSENLLNYNFLWINALNIFSPKRLELIIKAFLQKTKVFLISNFFLLLAFFVGMKNYLVIKLKFK